MQATIKVTVTIPIEITYEYYKGYPENTIDPREQPRVEILAHSFDLADVEEALNEPNNYAEIEEETLRYHEEGE